MKAMILAAGFGKRLGSLTQHTPKCLVEVSGKPILGWVIERLKAIGVSEIVINLHYLAQQVIDFVQANASFAINITFSFEPEILGSGGALKNVADYFVGEDAFIVHNADVWSDIDLKDLLDRHVKASAVATLALIKNQTSRPLIFNKNWQLIGWQDLSKNLNKGEFDQESYALSFSGIQVLSHKIFDYMRNYQGEFSSISVYLDAANQGAAIRGALFDSVDWVDIGTPENLEQLRNRLKVTKI